MEYKNVIALYKEYVLMFIDKDKGTIYTSRYHEAKAKEAEERKRNNEKVLREYKIKFNRPKSSEVKYVAENKTDAKVLRFRRDSDR